MSKIISCGSFFLLLFTRGITSLPAETLEDVLRAANLPVRQFSTSDLGAKITSYAISRGDPFLFAYYVDDGSGLLRPPLRLLRYDRATGNLLRADLRNATALFQGEIPLNCLGSALAIREYRGTIYPYPDDPQRRQYSRLLRPLISEKWCMEYNAQCDPTNFDTNLEGKVIVNEPEKLFGFQARFDAVGFGPATEKQLPPRTISRFNDHRTNRLLEEDRVD